MIEQRLLNSAKLCLIDLNSADFAKGSFPDGGAEGRSQLFLAEDWLKILRVYSGVVATSLFKVHIPSAG